MNSVFESINKKVLDAIKLSPYIDTVLIDLVKQGYWSEISIDHYPKQSVINLNCSPYAVVHHGVIVEKDLFRYDDVNTIEVIKPYVEYVNGLSNET